MPSDAPPPSNPPHNSQPRTTQPDADSTLETSDKVYRQSGFLAFLLSRLAAVFAMQIQAVVVAWQVYDITRDPLSLAYVGLAQFLPMVVLLLPAGDLVDRFERKRILQASWALQAVCSGLLLWLSFASSRDVSGYYAVLALFGCARAFTGPTLQSLLPQIVPRAQLAQAIALNSAIMKIAVIGGPLLGGLLYAFGAVWPTRPAWAVSCWRWRCCGACRCATREKLAPRRPRPGSASPPASGISAPSRSSSA